MTQGALQVSEKLSSTFKKYVYNVTEVIVIELVLLISFPLDAFSFSECFCGKHQGFVKLTIFPSQMSQSHEAFFCRACTCTLIHSIAVHLASNTPVLTFT